MIHSCGVSLVRGDADPTNELPTQPKVLGVCGHDCVDAPDRIVVALCVWTLYHCGAVVSCR